MVGAGIGGLAAAAALRQAGWTVTVLERSRTLSEVGAGLSLWTNALRALDALGLGDELRGQGALQGGGGVRTWDGRWLSRSTAAALDRQTGTAVLVVHRAELHRRLGTALPSGAVHLGCEVGDLEQDARSVTVHYREGGREQTLTADVAVAADGLHSGVRRQLWPQSPGPAYAGFTAWRGVTAAPVKPPPEPCVSWGRGSEFGIVPMVDERIYWFGTANLPAGTRFPDEHEEVLRRFGHWHEAVGTVLRATPPAAVLHHDIHDVVEPLAGFAKGRVVLLGDAAHAMTPNLGQGACQALEDAVVLGAVLRSEAGVPDALTAYDAQRRPRTQRVARSSRRAGRLIQAESPVATALRDNLIRFLPQRLAVAGAARLLDWEPPGPPAGPYQAAGA